MGSIRVIIGKLSSPSFSDGLRLLLSKEGSLNVIQIEEPEKLREALSVDQPQVLILEGDDPSSCSHYLDGTEHLSIIMLHPMAADAFICVRNPDHNRLIQIIEAIAPDSDERAETSSEGKIYFLKSNDFTRSAPVEVDCKLTEKNPAPDLSPIMNWLNLVLTKALKSMPQDGAGTSVPGWTMVASHAAEALQSKSTDLTDAELNEELKRVDEALFKNRESLPARICEIAEKFVLHAAEIRLLCLALAPELDGKFATAIGVLQDDLTRRRPGLTLLTDLLDETGSAWRLRQALAQDGSLCGLGLLVSRQDSRSGLAIDAGFAPSNAVLNFLLQETTEAAATALNARFLMPAKSCEQSSDNGALSRLKTALSQTGNPPLISLRGSGAACWFHEIASAANCNLLRADLRDVDHTNSERIGRFLKDWVAFSRLHNSILCIVGIDTLSAEPRHRAISLLNRLMPQIRLLALEVCSTDLSAIISKSATYPVWILERPCPSTQARSRLWLAAAERAGVQLGEADADKLASTLRTDASDMDACFAICNLERTAFETSNATAPNSSYVDGLRAAALEVMRRSTPTAVRRIDTVFSWPDIVLPKPIEQQLRTIPAHVTFSGKVLENWGFGARLPYGSGVAALFSGPSGTGKTMAAQIIARDLGVDLLQVDLSKTISKYIGETEKNLDQVFDSAERACAVLLFDEADALFGKRTEVKDAHDRHANVEVAYLLQRMEAFGGLAILTSNLKQNIDQAFLRRLRFAVDFPIPGSKDREAIWRRCFPADAPVDDTVDFGFLAGRLNLTGGNIQQIAIAAAFAAAAHDQSISMAHIIAAARLELVKVGMLNAEKALVDLVA